MAGTLDQSNTTGGTQKIFGEPDWGHMWYGIPFTAGLTGTLDQVTNSIVRGGVSFPNDYTVEIWSDSSGSPGSEITGTSSDPVVVNSDWTYNTYAATVSYEVTATTSYWIVLKPVQTPNWGFLKLDTDGASNTSKTWNSSAWNLNTLAKFATYVTVESGPTNIKSYMGANAP